MCLIVKVSRLNRWPQFKPTVYYVPFRVEIHFMKQCRIDFGRRTGPICTRHTEHEHCCTQELYFNALVTNFRTRNFPRKLKRFEGMHRESINWHLNSSDFDYLLYLVISQNSIEYVTMWHNLWLTEVNSSVEWAA